MFEEFSVLGRALYIGLAPTVKTWWELCVLTQIDELGSRKHPPLYCNPQHEGYLRRLVADDESSESWVSVQAVMKCAAQAPFRCYALGIGVRESCAQYLFVEAFATVRAAKVFPVPPWPKRSTLSPI